MKLAVAIASVDAGPSAFVVWRGFEESMRKAAECGYDGVELALKTAEDIAPQTLRRLLNKYGLEVSCISTGQVFAASGLYLTHPDRGGREHAIQVLSGLLQLAGEFGGLLNLGRVRGPIAEGQSRLEAEALFLDAVGRLCATAQKYEATLVIEPVNRYELNFINRLEEGAALIAKVACQNLGLMPDLFHMNIEEDRIGDSLVRHADLVRYIHFADSNRWSPGCGHLDFGEVFHSLQAAGFDGWAAIEILPMPDPDTAAARALAFIRPSLERYNATPKDLRPLPLQKPTHSKTGR
jgi:5-keto-L-gluconate epimerase